MDCKTSTDGLLYGYTANEKQAIDKNNEYYKISTIDKNTKFVYFSAFQPKIKKKEGETTIKVQTCPQREEFRWVSRKFTESEVNLKTGQTNAWQRHGPWAYAVKKNCEVMTP